MRAEVTELTNTMSQVFKSIHQHSYCKVENTNLYPGQPKLLALINKHEGITQKDLSKINFVTPATITGMLNKLEANHYVYRAADETDKRIMRVYLTPEGKSFAEKGERFMASMIDQLFVGFSDEELLALLAMTRRMKDNLNNMK